MAGTMPNTRPTLTSPWLTVMTITGTCVSREERIDLTCKYQNWCCDILKEYWYGRPNTTN